MFNDLNLGEAYKHSLFFNKLKLAKYNYPNSNGEFISDKPCDFCVRCQGRHTILLMLCTLHYLKQVLYCVSDGHFSA